MTYTPAQDKVAKHTCTLWNEYFIIYIKRYAICTKQTTNADDIHDEIPSFKL